MSRTFWLRLLDTVVRMAKASAWLHRFCAMMMPIAMSIAVADEPLADEPIEED